jgi:hypothetical protein
MFYNTPPKRKTQALDWQDGYGTTAFAFETPHSLKHCSERLSQLHNTSFWQRPKTAVEITPIDFENSEFHIRRYGYRYNHVVASGTLRRIDNNQTLVEGDVRYGDNIFGQYALVGGLGALFTMAAWSTPAFISALCVATLFVIFGSLMQWGMSSHNRDQMRQTIKELLCDTGCREL